MLGKLIKHEFKATARRIVPMLLIQAALAVIAGYVLPLLSNSQYGLVNFFYYTMYILFGASFVAVGIVALLLLIERFRKHILGDEGYSTMTLPVTVHEILWSKMIVFFVWFAAVEITATAAIMISGNVEPYQIDRIVQQLLAYPEPRGISMANYLLYGLEFVIFVFVVFSGVCLQVYASLMIGQQSTKAKMFVSVLVFIGFCILFSFLFVVVILAAEGISVPAFWDPLADLVLATKLHLGIIALIVIASVPGALFYLITAAGMKKSLNLE